MRFGALTLVVLLAGCTSPAGPQLGDQFRLRYGESASIAELDLWVRFIDVVDDSRCPADVTCVWSGDGAVLLEVAPLHGDSKEDVVHTTLEPHHIPLGRAELRLVRLDPYPVTSAPIARGDYVVTLVTRLTP